MGKIEIKNDEKELALYEHAKCLLDEGKVPKLVKYESTFLRRLLLKDKSRMVCQLCRSDTTSETGKVHFIEKTPIPGLDEYVIYDFKINKCDFCNYEGVKIKRTSVVGIINEEEVNEDSKDLFDIVRTLELNGFEHEDAMSILERAIQK